uniref:Uncharacterized protein n=1 Tax=Bionectria ochroleuca TaxID=29856 RepID=A0A0B7K452_BIOOC
MPDQGPLYEEIAATASPISSSASAVHHWVERQGLHRRISIAIQCDEEFVHLTLMILLRELGLIIWGKSPLKFEMKAFFQFSLHRQLVSEQRSIMLHSSPQDVSVPTIMIYFKIWMLTPSKYLLSCDHRRHVAPCC